MTPPLVTVMIPTYNQGEYLEENIESILKQTYQNLEIVISDDASPDPRVHAVLDKYKTQGNIRIFRNKINLGRVRNYRTTLYERARGEWVINLDGDDFFYDPTFIEQAMVFIEKNPGLVMVSGRVLNWVEESQKMIQTSANAGSAAVLTPEQAYLGLLNDENLCWHATTVYNRQIAMAIDFYRHDIVLSDRESIYRLMACGNVGFLPVWAAAWRLHKSNASRNQTCEEQIANLKAFVAPRSMIDNPRTKANPAFLQSWVKLFLFKKTEPLVRRFLKTNPSLRSYFLYIWAITKLCPSAGMKHLFRPRNILRMARLPFVKGYEKLFCTTRA